MKSMQIEIKLRIISFSQNEIKKNQLNNNKIISKRDVTTTHFMMTSWKQRKLTFNCLLKDITGS